MNIRRYDIKDIIYKDIISFNEYDINIIKISNTWYYYYGDILRLIGYSVGTNHCRRYAKQYNIDYIYVSGLKNRSYISHTMTMNLLEAIANLPASNPKTDIYRRTLNAKALKQWLTQNPTPLDYSLDYPSNVYRTTINNINKGDNTMSEVKPEITTPQTISDTNLDTDLQMYDNLIYKIRDTYIQKNKAYGDSFEKTFNDLGIISAVTRISDKYNRICALAKDFDKKTIDIGDEPIVDTLLDLANYCLMTVKAIEKQNNNK